MKKKGLLKSLLILLLLIVVLSYIIPGRGGQVAYIGLFDVILNYLQSYYYFFDTAIFILIVGGFYGVLNKTGAYKKLIDNIVTKLKPNGKNFVIISIIVFALITALTGITVPLFIFIPFVVSIILLLGYDKLVAISATFISSLVGLLGGIFINFKDPSNYYGTSFTTFEGFLGLKSNYVNIFPKILLLVLAVALLIFHVLKYIKNVENKKVKYELNDKEEVKITEVKNDYKSIKVWPLVVILSVLLILIILGLTPWNSLFGIEVFDKFNTWINGIAIKKFAVFSSIISANLVAFGNWGSMGNYIIPSLVLIIFTLIIKIVYKVKFSDAINEFAEGMKKALPTAAIIILAYTVLVCSYNNGFVETIIGYTSKFNIALTSLISILGSLVQVDLYYNVASVLTTFVSTYTDKSVYPVLAVLFQSIYGLVSLIAPTSILLIIGLKYYDIPYLTWIKYIWRLLLKLIILVLGIVLIVSLL